MTKTDWLAIASMVVTIMTMLVAPVWSAWITSRMTQPNPNPDDANRRNLNLRILGVMKSALNSVWFLPSLTVSISLFSIFYHLHEGTTVTKEFVVKIAVDVSGVTLGLLSYFVRSMIDLISLQTIHSVRIGERMKRLADAQASHVQLTRMISETVHAKIKKKPKRLG